NGIEPRQRERFAVALAQHRIADELHGGPRYSLSLEPAPPGRELGSEQQTRKVVADGPGRKLARQGQRARREKIVRKIRVLLEAATKPALQRRRVVAGSCEAAENAVLTQYRKELAGEERRKGFDRRVANDGPLTVSAGKNHDTDRTIAVRIDRTE